MAPVFCPGLIGFPGFLISNVRAGTVASWWILTPFFHPDTYKDVTVAGVDLVQGCWLRTLQK